MSRLLPLGLLFLVQLVVFHHSSRIPMDSPSAQATPPDVGTIESLDSDCEMSSIDAGSYTSSNRDSDFILWEEVQEIQLLHEATLQELLSLVPEGLVRSPQEACQCWNCGCPAPLQPGCCSRRSDQSPSVHPVPCQMHPDRLPGLWVWGIVGQG